MPKNQNKGQIQKKEVELPEIHEGKETELKELERRTREIAESRKALMNILEDAEIARVEAEGERDKTLAIIENFPEGLLFFDQKNELSSTNPKVRDFFDLEPENILGKDLEALREIPSFLPLIEILGEELEVYQKELKLTEGLVLEVSTIAIMSAEEKVGTLVILRDITREKIIERLKTEFVSIAAHQLRTPLSAIKWTLRMILDGDLGEISQEQRKFLEGTYGSNERMIRLNNDLLNVTRIKEGRFLYNIQSRDIIEIVEGVIDPMKEIARRKKVKFSFKTPKKEIPKVKIDSEKVSLAIQNLIDNAIHYTKSGGEVKVSLRYSKKEKQILFSVKDSGIGIPKGQQKRVFTRFFRAANAVRAETEGTGLGLFIAKNVIEAHEGKIWFESVEGKGTTFYFTLPT